MTMISVEKTLFKDLLDYKIRSLTKEIMEILNKWHYDSGLAFIEDVRSGKVKEGEMDAIELRQLLHDQKELIDLNNQQD